VAVVDFNAAIVVWDFPEMVSEAVVDVGE